MLMQTKRTNQGLHDRIVQMVANHVRSLGYRPVCADLAGCKQPAPIDGHIPDVTGYFRGHLGLICEVETSDSISDAHAGSQWSAFSRQAVLSRARFAVAVPKGYAQSAQNRLGQLGLSALVWEF